MKEILLDGNVLVSLVIDSHVHHLRARRWFRSLRNRFATCVITQGTFLRVHMAMAQDSTARLSVVVDWHRCTEFRVTETDPCFPSILVSPVWRSSIQRIQQAALGW